MVVKSLRISLKSSWKERVKDVRHRSDVFPGYMTTASLIADSTQISQGAEAVSDPHSRSATRVSQRPRRKSTKLTFMHLSARMPKSRSY